MVELKNKEDKIRFMKNKSKLRKLTVETIYIDNYWILKEKQIQRNIKKVTVEEMQKGCQVKVGYENVRGWEE